MYYDNPQKLKMFSGTSNIIVDTLIQGNICIISRRHLPSSAISAKQMPKNLDFFLHCEGKSERQTPKFLNTVPHRPIYIYSGFRSVSDYIPDMTLLHAHHGWLGSRGPSSE